MTQPNILFLMTDQQRWDALSCAAGDRAAPLRRLHLADAFDALVRHEDRPGHAHRQRVDLARRRIRSSPATPPSASRGGPRSSLTAVSAPSTAG